MARKLLTDAGEMSYSISSSLLAAACSTIGLPGRQKQTVLAKSIEPRNSVSNQR